MTVVLHGATGYTGRLVAAELVRREIDLTLAGRSADRLARVSEEHAGGAPFRVVAAHDRPALRRLLDDAAVVINCAGPFMRAGDAVVESAVETGTHYLDSTGEQTYMRMVFDRHGSLARERGVALVPAMGFDFAPGDCLARIVARHHEPVDELVLAYSVDGFEMTRGTMRSALEMLSGGDVLWENRSWRAAPTRVARASFAFPEPIGRRAMSPYPAGEIVTVPRHTDVRTIHALLTTDTAAPHPALAPLLPFAMPALALALRTPLRDVLTRAIGVMPEGPEEATRRAARFTVAAVARGEDGSTGSGVVHGEDIYGLTAATLAYGAERMAAADYEKAGALGPAAAFDPVELLDHPAHRLSWEAGPPAAVAA